MFSLFSDLTGDALEPWKSFCEAAACRLEGRLREGVDTEAEMEPLCIAAAALAYGDYLMLEGADGLSDEVQVGDIRLKSGAAATVNRRDAEEICDYFLAGVAHLLEPDCPALLAVGDPA